MIFAENSEMYIPKINCEKWYVFLGAKSLKKMKKYIPKCIIIIWYVNSQKYTKSL